MIRKLWNSFYSWLYPKENKMNGEELYTAYETEWEKFNTGVDKWCELTEIDRHVWNRVATRLNTNATPPSEPYQDCPLHFVA